MNRLVSRSPAPAVLDETARIAVLPIGTTGPGDARRTTSDTLPASAITAELSRNFPLHVLPPLTILDSGGPAISRALPALLGGICESLSRSDTGALVVVSAHRDRHSFADVAAAADAQGVRLALFPTPEDWTWAGRATRYATIHHRRTADHGTLLLRSLVLRFRNALNSLSARGA
ncbi:hypothetical protein Aph01nite_21840 [Acrocarpospora phusangensis]|uniref:Uncharacterized protein n=1 Tax=Acrocarpospora phusangensis TaxID=1070424 RepID=A0A919Q9W4_9ACTN|nr:hypothetical protein [Acrocarpospora phusangensis]GIH23874.1 hypothetical protein Aph01nite_21840 [Acrocarpospora phusangensis]